MNFCGRDPDHSTHSRMSPWRLAVYYVVAIAISAAIVLNFGRVAGLFVLIIWSAAAVMGFMSW